MVLYFRFLKYISWFFFIFAILSAPALYFAITAGQNFGVNGLKDYKGALYLTTLGSIGRGATDCVQAKLNDNINFSCEKGQLGSSVQYGRVLETSTESCELFSPFSWDAECNNNNPQAIQDAYKACEGASSCQIQVDSSFFDFSKPGCQQWDPSQNPTATFYFRALCDDIEIDLPGGATIAKEVVGYIITSLDALICILFVFMLITLKFLEKKTVQNIEGNIDSVDGFSLKVSNLPNKNHQELKRELWKHFSKTNDNEAKKEHTVVDVQLAESQVILDLKVKLGVVRAKKIGLLRKFYAKWVHPSQSKDKRTELTYDELHELAQGGDPLMLDDFKMITKLEKTQNSLKAKLQQTKNKNRSRIRAAFITFETKHERDQAFKHYRLKGFSRFYYSLFGKSLRKNDPNVFMGTYLKVKTAPAPNDIIWTNLDVSKKSKFLRRLVSWVITIGLWAISFAFIIFVKSEQEDIAELVRPTQACPSSGDISESAVREDMSKGDESLGLLECFCRSSLQRQLFNSLCSDWTVRKLANNALPFLIVAAIIFTNYCLQYVFQLLSSFERYQNISTESTSRVIKIFVAQFLNTGVILLIVNARFTKSPVVSFLGGNYADLIPEWYLNVGTTLLITMIINIVNLPIINTLAVLFKGCARCWDRGCTCDETKTKQTSQEKWEKLYTGPEFLVDFRYAQILTVVFICFFYSAGLPILYLSSFLNLFALYWMDKLFLLKACRLPRVFDRNLENIVRKALYYAIFFHLIFAVWTYGNPQIFGDEEAFSKAAEIAGEYKEYSFRYLVNTLYRRALQYQNIALSLLFLIFVAIVLAKFFLKNAIQKMFRFCFSRHGKVLDEIKAKNSKKYFHFIHLEDLYLERKYLNKQIYETTDEELQELLQIRLGMVNQEIRNRDPEAENHMKKFIGVFSYFVGHNPVYKRFFDPKGAQEEDEADRQEMKSRYLVN